MSDEIIFGPAMLTFVCEPKVTHVFMLGSIRLEQSGTPPNWFHRRMLRWLLGIRVEILRATVK